MRKKKNSLSDRLTSTKLYSDAQEIKKAPAEEERKSPADDNALVFTVPEIKKPVKKKKVKLSDRLVNVREEDMAKDKGDVVVTKKGLEERNRELEREIEEDFKTTELENDKKERRFKLSTRMINVALILGCVYMIFLIYGVMVTDYTYNDKGRIGPQVMTVEDIKKEKEFEKLLVQYEKCRVLYEKVLMINYRLGEGTEDPLVIAPEYQELLEKNDVNVSDIAIKLNALEMDPKYDTIKAMMLNWVQNDAALYLQFISTAISNNDADAAVSAIQYKDLMYDDFSKITQNIIAIGDKIKGVDITGVKEWTPESYVDKQVNGE